MRQGIVKYNNIKAGLLTEEDNGEYLFEYDPKYVQTYPNQFITFQMPVLKGPTEAKACSRFSTD